MQFFSARALLGLIALAVTITSGCAKQAGPETDGRMLVAASIAPIYFFAKQVAGDQADVELLVPTTVDAHTFQLGSAEMKTLARARVLVLNGIDLEYWADKAATASGNQNLLVVETGEGIDHMDACDDHSHKGGNPHVWLNPKLAARQVVAIREAFIQADPSGSEIYSRNADAFLKELDTLDTYIHQKLDALTQRKFIAQHASWVYFAQEYGLEEIGVLETTTSAEPSPRQVAHMTRLAREFGIRTVFSEPQISHKAAEALAREIDGEVVLLDPFGTPPDYDYIATMRKNAELIASGLK